MARNKPGGYGAPGFSFVCGIDDPFKAPDSAQALAGRQADSGVVGSDDLSNACVRQLETTAACACGAVRLTLRGAPVLRGWVQGCAAPQHTNHWSQSLLTARPPLADALPPRTSQP